MNSSMIVMRIVKICARVLVLVVLFSGAVLIGRGSYDFGYRVFTETAMDNVNEGRQVSVQISKGMSNKDIAALMEDSGLCESKNLFYVQLELSEYKDEIKPGLYVLSTSMKPEEIIGVLGGKNSEDSEENEE